MKPKFAPSNKFSPLRGVRRKRQRGTTSSTHDVTRVRNFYSSESSKGTWEMNDRNVQTDGNPMEQDSKIIRRQIFAVVLSKSLVGRLAGRKTVRATTYP